MTPKELAEKLNGIEYRIQFDQALIDAAQANGIVIVYGQSDDLMEFRGAINDEIGAYEGTTAWVTREGLAISFEQALNDGKDALREYFKKEDCCTGIRALWAEEDGISWTFKTEIPHETFMIVEDGEPYCRGIVFALKDVPL
jgi:hypothetical protein